MVVTQRRESCWGLSPPRGQPGRGLCHTFLGGLFSRFSWHRVQLASLCVLCPPVTDASVLCLPLVTDTPVPCVPMVTDAPVPRVPMVTYAPVPCVPLVSVAPVPYFHLVMGLELCDDPARGHWPWWGPGIKHS